MSSASQPAHVYSRQIHARGLQLPRGRAGVCRMEGDVYEDAALEEGDRSVPIAAVRRGDRPACPGGARRRGQFGPQ